MSPQIRRKSDDRGNRYQVKGRRVAQHNGSRQLGILRDLDEGRFDLLAAILFWEGHAGRPGPPPVGLGKLQARGTNGWRFLLRDAVWDWPGVRDVTDALRTAEDGLG